MKKNIRVLFVGNSHTYMNDMPALFAEIFELTSGRKADVVMLAYSGRDLAWHMNEYFSLRYNLLYGDYDYCVIQQAAHPFPGHDVTLDGAGKIISLCKQTDTVPVMFMTWAEKKYPEHQQIMSETYRDIAANTQALLAPVGEVFAALKDDPSVDLYYSDGEHASPYGDLLTAAVICGTILFKSDLVLPDEIIDYHVSFGNEEGPSAWLDKNRMKVKTDRRKAAKILDAVRSVMG